MATDTTTSASDSTMAAKTATPRKRWKSRAVTRTVDAGNSAYCAVCDELIKFRARIRAEQIICNVYVKNRWDRVEHYHPDCYEQADSPYGEPNG
ncbi:hypothetical protein [Candidatus Poriferisodalis sp.]|uniref:hypothetical protein n=1 Tax=Candidatus Poriferisodalis sp. TaxID=3101277 RepID=UPI003D14A78D